MNGESSSENPIESGTISIEDQTQAFKELSVHVGTGKKLRVETRCACHERLNGYLVGLSQELGLMHCFHDFMPDGYTVFRLTDIISIRSNEYERLWDRMLEGEGLLGGLTMTPNIDLNDIGSAIESISTKFMAMIIEIELPEDEDAEFYIGQVESLNATEIQFDHFDGLGKWESEPALIQISEISFVEFETPYINTFCKYLDHFKTMKPG